MEKINNNLISNFILTSNNAKIFLIYLIETKYALFQKKKEQIF